MSKMDFSGFKKVAQDEHTATFRHEKLGHELKIAHKKLSPKLKGQLDSLPIQKFDAGGGVQGVSEMDEGPIDSDQRAPVPAPPAAAPTEGVYQDTPGGVSAGTGDTYTPPGASADAPATNAGDGPGPATMPSPANQDPLGMAAAGQAQIKALGQQEAGQQAAEKAKGDLGAAQAQEEKAHQDRLQAAQTTFQGTMDHLNDQDQKLQADIAAGHVDPKKYVDSMSTGSKISTGIGLILGGMGSGLTHGPNLAFQYLQSQIDRDIDAQKADLGKKQNLLAHNMALMGNARAGMDLTRMQLGDMVNSHLRMSADNAATPMAAGAAQAIGGLFEGQKAQIKQNLAIHQAQQGAFSGGQASPMVMESLSPEMRERAVQMPGGGLRLATTKKGAEQVREQLQTIQPIFNILDRLKSLGPTAMVPGTPANQAAKAMQAQAIPIINENAGLKRLSAEDIGNIRQTFTDPTKFSSLFTSAKTDSFKGFLQDKLMSTMSQQLEGQTGVRSQSAGHNFGFTPKKSGSK